MSEQNLKPSPDEHGRFIDELGRLTDGNLSAEVINPSTNPCYQVFDEEGHNFCKFPLNTPPQAVANAWRASLHAQNQAFERGRNSAFKQLRELIGAKAAE